MAVRKKHLFDWPQQELGAYGQALGHPARVQILEVLSMRGRCSFADLSERIPLATTTVAFHCQKLKSLGWMELCSLDNGEAGYRLSKEAVQDAVGAIQLFCMRLMLDAA
ncbi:MAG: winged helix-turn-helix domain-containing protein [Bacteroidota bacterium]